MNKIQTFNFVPWMYRITHSSSQEEILPFNKIIICFKCRMANPNEFILLLCDHVLCEQCVDEAKNNCYEQYQAIQCPCNCITSFRKKEKSSFKKGHKKNKSSQERLSYSLSRNRNSVEPT